MNEREREIEIGGLSHLLLLLFRLKPMSVVYVILYQSYSHSFLFSTPEPLRYVLFSKSFLLKNCSSLLFSSLSLSVPDFIFFSAFLFASLNDQSYFSKQAILSVSEQSQNLFSSVMGEPFSREMQKDREKEATD